MLKYCIPTLCYEAVEKKIMLVSTRWYHIKKKQFWTQKLVLNNLYQILYQILIPTNVCVLSDWFEINSRLILDLPEQRKTIHDFPSISHASGKSFFVAS